MYLKKTNRNVFTLVSAIVLGAVQVPANADPSWSLRTNDGPRARASHALAYDSARGVTVLFGGFNYETRSGFGDTWEWDGNAWMQRFPTTSPAPRWGPVMVYDSVRNVTVLFGGTPGPQKTSGTPGNGTGAPGACGRPLGPAQEAHPWPSTVPEV